MSMDVIAYGIGTSRKLNEKVLFHIVLNAVLYALYVAVVMVDHLRYVPTNMVYVMSA